MLDFRIETFLCVCRCMSFTKAAGILNITQPAVSQHIKYLENYYDAKLFEYNNKKLSLTKQGSYLKRSFETLSHDSLRIKEDIAGIHKTRKLKIGATRSIGEYYIPPAMAAFMKNHNDIQLSVTVDDTRKLLELLDNGNIDFAFCEGYFNKSDYDYKLMKKEKICALCSVDYDLPDIESIEDLFSQRLLIREKGSGTREIFERYLTETGFSIDSFTNCCDFTSPHLIIEMLLAGQGISFLYHTVAKDCIQSGTLKEIDIPVFHLSHEFNALWKKGSLYQKEYQSIVEEFIEYEKSRKQTLSSLDGINEL